MAISPSDSPTPLRVPAVQPPDTPERSARCTNCDAPVSGKYCSVCGQRVEYHLHSLWDFLREAVEVLTHADSRLWRTLGPLLFRPGFLTQQFLAGHRASYLPPLRLYFVLSVLFFLVVSVTSPVTTRSPSETAAVDRTASDLRSAPQAASDELCRSSVGHLPGPDWIRRPFLSACQRSHADQSRALGRSFVQNLGRAMFLFLPLLAAFMTPMYSRARRYYVDNLLLLVHNHAFVFLLMSIYLLALHWMQWGTWTTLLTLAFSCYVVFYSYRSMQRVYAETWLRTLVKFTAIALGYVICALCTVFLTGLYSAETL
jgi:hypothetical protein